MGKFVKGDIVIIPFPFTDLSNSKKRPAFVVADLTGDDIIVCQITSKSKSDPFALIYFHTIFMFLECIAQSERYRFIKF
jgi:mRNA interferase MazF